MSDNVEVLIVGAGPAGLIAANLLGHLGINVLLVEQNGGLSDIPKALMVDDEFFRLLNTVGLAEPVKAHGVGPVGYDHYSPLGFRVARIAGRITEHNFPSRTATFQPRFEKILYDGARRFPSVKVRFNQRLVGFRETATGVEAQLRDANGDGTTVLARYLLGADGSHSTVRKLLNIPFEELVKFGHRHIVVDVTGDANESRTAQLKIGWRRSASSLPAPDRGRRYEFSLRPGEDGEAMLDEATLRGLFRTFGDYTKLKVIRKAVYTFHSRLAARMHSGRVFLLGDAAHIMPVHGSQGMNSGARDANNLAWKLAAVLRHGADAAILDSYDSERREHVSETIRIATAQGKLQSARSWPASIVRDLVFGALSLFPRSRRYIEEMRYIPKPVLRHGLVVPEQGEGGLVGRILSLPRIVADGETRLLDDLLGYAFALLGVAPHGALPAGADHPLWRKLGARIVTVHQPGAVGGGAIDGVQHAIVADGRFDPVFARYAGQWLVIRPDRVVAAASSAADLVDTARALSGRFAVPALIVAAE